MDEAHADTDRQQMLDSWAVKLRTQIAPVVHVCVSDVSDGHTVEGFKDGRAQRKDGLELLVMVVSDVFDGVKLMERHRMVNDALCEELASGVIHAMQIRSWTIKQWEGKGKPASVKEGRPCSHHYMPGGNEQDGAVDSTLGSSGSAAEIVAGKQPKVVVQECPTSPKASPKADFSSEGNASPKASTHRSDL